MSKFTEALSTKRTPSVQEKIKATLDPESHKDFMSAMDDPGLSAAAIQRALKDLGIEVSVMTIQRWRQK